MVLKFATKRDASGNRYFLGVDTESKNFALTSSHWFCRDDVIEINKRDKHKLQEQLENEGYTQIYTI